MSAAPSEDLPAAPAAGTPGLVFISYSRDDESAVAALADALAAQGLAVWRDRTHIAPGTSWRAGIEAALQAARCVVVAWTPRSVASDYVLDEADHARERGVLVPVLLQPVRLPAPHGQMQALDLTGWDGDPADPGVQRLAEVVRAKVAQQPVPPARSTARWRGATLVRVGAGMTILAGAGFVLFGALDRLCGASWQHDGLSDACGALQLGGRPGAAERRAWTALEPGNCAALRAHIARFPAGALRPVAEARLNARREVPAERLVQQRYPFVVSHLGQGPARGEATEPAARATATALAQADAERQCGLRANADTRVVGAQVQADRLQCSRGADGVRCSFDGHAVCTLEHRVVTAAERCDA